MIKAAYESVMNPEKNAFRRLTPVVRFQLMTVLAWMWSLIFTLWIGSLAVFGPTVIGHMLLILGLFATRYAFRSARRPQRAQPGVPRPRV